MTTAVCIQAPCRVRCFIAFFRRVPGCGLARVVAGLLAMVVCLSMSALHAAAQEPAKAAQRPALVIPIFLSSRTDLCYDRGYEAAITKLATLEQDRINAQGGVAGRLIQLRFLDDKRNASAEIANVRTALANSGTIATIGLSNSNRAKSTFEALGKEIGSSGIPFLSNISVNRIFAPYRNVFTTRASQDDERVPVMAEFIRKMGFERPSYVGRTASVFSAALGDGLRAKLGEGRLVSDHRLAMAGEELEPAGVAAMIADLKQRQPDLVVLSVGTSRTAGIMKAMAAAGVTPSIFLVGSIDRLPADVANSWPNAMYQLTWDRLPDAFSERLRRRVDGGDRKQWVFEGTKVAEAPGWAKGQCKARPETERTEALDDANQRAIAVGTQHADMVALIAEAVRSADPRLEVAALRRHVLQQMASKFAVGKGTFKGSFENWSFDPSSRAATRTPFVIILPQGLGRTQLAPIQFVRVKDGTLKQIETIYADIDLIKTYRVDDNEKTFYAQFYLSMHAGRKASIDQIEFTNAYLDPRTGGRQITIEVVHAGGPSAAYPETMRIYKISGRFVFEPELESYPFDTQRFAIELQPRKGDDTFIIQPPPLELRDRQVETDGWTQRDQYVGYEEDFVPVVDAFTHAPSIVPFYKASFVWLMQRQTTDYYLRVVVPLAFILIVAYLSIFIPHTHFEAIVTIQVTALLSAVALYLSLPKLDADTATLSDRIFVFDYMMVSLMIVISILRVNRSVATRAWLKSTLGVIHVVVVPLLVAGMAFYVMGLSVAADKGFGP